MKIAEYLQNDIGALPKRIGIGIDLGSRQAKAVLINKDEFYTAIGPTGYFLKKTGKKLVDSLLEQSGLKEEDIEFIVVTGYGRISLSFENTPFRSVTEIACHGKGAHHLAEGVRTIIDIGGQDSKVISIDPEDGHVVDFVMNDKCAAGTGRFLEKMAAILGLDVTEIGEISLKSEQPSTVNSTCVVFAESEVVAKRAKGESVADLAAGIHYSVAVRIRSMLSRVGIKSNVLFTGGVSNNIGVKHVFEKNFDIRISETKLDTVYAGALGAAIFAISYAEKGIKNAEESEDGFLIDISDYEKAVARAHENFTNKSNGTKSYVASTCSYTPLEVLAAADVSHIRLLHKGSGEEVAAGETITQSMQCDFHKSILGSFMLENPEYKAIDRLYTFYSCSCMRKTMEAVDELYVQTDVFNVQRRHDDPKSKEYLRDEIIAFKENLEELTNEKISEEKIEYMAEQYNKARKLIREIAEYRKLDHPIINSTQFQKIVEGYYTLSIDDLLSELGKVLVILKASKQYGKTGKRKLRFMISGGIVATGDDKVVKILEKDMKQNVVVEDNCTGIKPLGIDVKPEGEDIYARLSESYLGKAPCARMFKPEQVVRNALKLAQEYDVDGVILYYLKFCPCYSLLEKLYNDIFKAAGIPVFIFSGDYSTGDEGQLKTRLEAFAEMLSEMKGI